MAAAAHLKWTFVQQDFGKSEWKPVLTETLEEHINKVFPALHTVLSTDTVAENPERNKVRYLGPLYIDWDSATIDDAIVNACAGVELLKDKGVNPYCIRLYATGGRGFHAEIPMQVFMTKIPVAGITYLPAIYKDMMLKLATEDMDLSIYSMGRGRMWRTANVKRSNGNYKVPITWDELREMTADRYAELCSAPRRVTWDAPELAAEMVALFDTSDGALRSRISALKPMKSQQLRDLMKKPLPSITAMCAGRGIRAGTGFQEVVVQLSITAHAKGWDVETFIKECQGIIDNHEGDSDRYSTPAKREKELRRMWAYMQDNPCYTFSTQAIRAMLNHSAEDLTDLGATEEEVLEGIAAAEEGRDAEDDSYRDLARSIQIRRQGLYTRDEEDVTRRVSPVSFDSITEIRDLGDDKGGCVTQAYSAQILLNGRGMGSRDMAMDTFSSSKQFNTSMLQLGVAAHVNDQHVREVVNAMKGEASKKKRVVHITRREGLDILQVPMHEDPAMRAPFLAWADTRSVEVAPGAEFARALNLRMVPVKQENAFNTDLTNAPDLAEALDVDGARETLASWLDDMLRFQAPSTVAKVLGWLTAAFFKPLFQEVYKQFPLLHVYGDAGTGKTASISSLLYLHYYQSPPAQATPTATMYAIQQLMACSMSIPLLLDEYKPHIMGVQKHEQFKAVFRDAYNSKSIVRGGGSDKDRHYSVLTRSELSAPIVYVGEYPENETAVAERSIFAPYRRKAATEQAQSLRRFLRWSSDTSNLSMIGLYIARTVLMRYSIDQFRREFDDIHNLVVGDLMLPDDLTGLSTADIEQRSKMTARPVFNLAVCKFGLSIFRGVLYDIYETEFKERFGELWSSIEENVYTGVSDAASRSMPEWAKVLNTISMMSNQKTDLNWKPTLGVDYWLVAQADRTLVEFDPRILYGKYREYTGRSGSWLFLNAEAFASALLSSPVYVKSGAGQYLRSNQGITLDYEAMMRTGIDPFKA